MNPISNLYLKQPPLICSAPLHDSNKHSFNVAGITISTTVLFLSTTNIGTMLTWTSHYWARPVLMSGMACARDKHGQNRIFHGLLLRAFFGWSSWCLLFFFILLFWARRDFAKNISKMALKLQILSTPLVHDHAYIR